MEGAVMKLVQAQQNASNTPIPTTDNEEAVMINGINVMRLPSRDVYSYALNLMDLLFTKEEMGASLIFKSKKSDKPELDQVRVNRLLNCVEKKYGKDWDLKQLTAKVNQKCRDSRDPRVKTESTASQPQSGTSDQAQAGATEEQADVNQAEK